MRKIVSVILLLAMALSLFACSKPDSLGLKPEEIKDVVDIEMSVKNYGKMTFELYHDIAPITVKNFVSLVNDGFYNGTVFHRVVKNFMILGGDDNGDGISGSSNVIKGEFSNNGYSNPIKHERGVISMARTNDPNSASSQFFIMHEKSPGLDGNYAAFGMMKDGFETLDKIANVATVANSDGEKSVPVEKIVLDYVIITGTHDRDDSLSQGTGWVDVEALYEKTIDIELSIKDFGTIKLELYPDLAPITVDNFVSLARDGFYDGLTFHRIIENFMIQGGDPEGTGMGGSDTKIKGEFSSNGIYNPLSHERGVISMARSNTPNSASSQFFIVHKDSVHLDGDYAAFGRVTEGIEVVDAIAALDTNGSDAPLQDVIIDYVIVLTEVTEEETDTDKEESTEESAPDTSAPTDESIPADTETGEIVPTESEGTSDETAAKNEYEKLEPEIM